VNDLSDVLDALGTPRLLVVGDVMLDIYTWGDAERVSPEAPVVVLRAEGDEVRLGGAASVAFLLRGFGADVALAAVVGTDPRGRLARRLLEEAGIDQTLVFDDPHRPTTVKERILGRSPGRQPHQILRLDREDCRPLCPELEAQLISAISEELPSRQAVLVADYAKGVGTPRLLSAVITAGAEGRVPILVDPARLRRYGRYRGATLLKPNRIEAELATGRPIRTIADAVSAVEELHLRLDGAAVLLTLDAEGMVLAVEGRSAQHFPARRREVYDITGAGDMALALVGLCQAAGITWPDTVRLANAAAGLQVERLGVAQVTRAELRAELSRKAGSPRGKILTGPELPAMASAYRAAGHSIVFTNGCFDLLHIGHVTCLQEAAEFGDVLFVGVNSDESVRALKGPGRPVIGLCDRVAMLAALECVDHLVVFDGLAPNSLLDALRPDVLAKGGTYHGAEQVVGRDAIEGWGGKVLLTTRRGGASTTDIIKTVRLAPNVHLQCGLARMIELPEKGLS